MQQQCLLNKSFQLSNPTVLLTTTLMCGLMNEVSIVANKLHIKEIVVKSLTDTFSFPTFILNQITFLSFLKQIFVYSKKLFLHNLPWVSFLGSEGSQDPSGCKTISCSSLWSLKSNRNAPLKCCFPFRTKLRRYWLLLKVKF